MRNSKGTKEIGGKLIATALCCSMLGGVAGAGGYAALSKMNTGSNGVMESISETAAALSSNDDAVQKTPVQSTSSSTVEEGKSASQIYEENVNSTVGITTSISTNYFGYETSAAASGSGFILSEDGYIVTNYHVVKDADTIKVTTYDDTAYDAKLVGYDETNDIAVLKVDATGLKPVTIGDSDQLSVGDDVVAIGNPLGELTFSLTSGTVSALDRKVTIQNNAMNLIQTDCAINSGNSGGALFNDKGEVIGITNAKSSGSYTSASVDNIGFAIPINSVNDIIDSIIDNGYIMKPYIGITGGDVDSQYQLSGFSGVVVSDVEKNSPADQAGIEKNDIITKFNDTKISGMSELRSLIQNTSEDDTIKLTVYRDGSTKEIEVKPVMHKQDARP